MQSSRRRTSWSEPVKVDDVASPPAVSLLSLLEGRVVRCGGTLAPPRPLIPSRGGGRGAQIRGYLHTLAVPLLSGARPWPPPWRGRSRLNRFNESAAACLCCSSDWSPLPVAQPTPWVMFPCEQRTNSQGIHNRAEPTHMHAEAACFGRLDGGVVLWRRVFGYDGCRRRRAGCGAAR